jgi:hypothetical protein
MFQQQPGWRQASVYFLIDVSVASPPDSGSALGQVSSLQQNVVGYLECPVTRMRNIDVLVPILMLAMCHVAASQSSAPAGSKAPARSALKLKSVELDNKYTIQIPDYFTVHQISDRIAAAPTYSFSAAQPHNSVVEFTEIHFGPSKKVTGFQGDGKLLRDVIVPSLTSIH